MILHLIFLTTATILTWLWTTSEGLSFYTLQLTALLVLVFFFKNTFKIENRELKINQYLDAVILTMVVLLLVFSTGGLNSPLFFLTYFLLFGISFLFEPKLSIFFSIILIIFFTYQAEVIFLPDGSPHNLLNQSQPLIKLFSLILVSPLALFFGQQFLQNLADKKRVKIYQKKWLNNEKSLESQETNTLFWLSLNFKKRLAEIIEISATMLTNFSSLSPHQQNSIQKIKENAEHLLAEGEKLKKIVDEETDSADTE
jgi:hypothetical protein